MKILIIVPAYNEQDNIVKVIEAYRKINIPCCDMLVVNDCSTDRTEQVLKETGISYLSSPINLGIGGAVQLGYRYARRYGYDIAIQIDGDGQHDIRYIKEMIEFLETDQADIVIGSRFIEKKGFQSSASRRIGIKILSVLIFLCTGKRVLDVTSGYRAINRRFIEIYAQDYPEDYPEPEAIVAALMHRGRIKEVPVCMKERENGISSINLKKSVYYMIKVTLAILVCRISFGVRRSKR